MKLSKRIKNFRNTNPFDSPRRNFDDCECSDCKAAIQPRKGYVIGSNTLCLNCFLARKEVAVFSPQKFMTTFAKHISDKRPKQPLKKGAKPYVTIVYNATESNRRKH